MTNLLALSAVVVSSLFVSPTNSSLVNPILLDGRWVENPLVIKLELATNWTGYMVGTNELGYVLTNHVAEITYQSNKYSFTLTNTVSDKAVWRPTQTLYVTNYNEWPKWERYIFTNNIKGL